MKPSSTASDTCENNAVDATDIVIRNKPAITLDRYALLRLQQSPSSQGGHLATFLSDRSRAKCASMSSQF